MSLAARLAELEPTPPRILTLDIETSPSVVYAWGLWDQNIATSQVIDPSRVLCWAGKWLGKTPVEFKSEFHHGRDSMIEAAWQALNTADIVIGYNHARFDIPHLQREFVQAGYGPPSPWVDIDLLTIARRNFKFLSNKLGYVTDALGLDTKLETGGQQLWTRVMAGERKAWAEFKAYNKQDVEVTESLYLYLRPWIKVPHAGLFTGNVASCYSCGGTQLTADGIHRTGSNAWLRLSCPCGAWNKQLANGETRPA